MFMHEEAAAGSWERLSLCEQMGNIGSEVSRTRKWRGRDERLARGAFERGLELFDLTIADRRRTLPELREIARAREVFCDAWEGGSAYGTTLESLDRYFLPFAVAARAGR